jgi:GR25 family glycosyltransferase involved in LPS biosynthesis
MAPLASSFRIYCISESGSARFERAKARIESLGAEFVHVPAIRPTVMSPAYEGAEMRRSWGCDMKLAELGCFLAHRSAWQSIVAQERGPVVVVEDDIGFKPEAAAAIRSVVAKMPRADFVSLYSDWQRHLLRSIEVGGGVRIGIPSSTGNTTVAYAIGPEGARALLKGSETITRPVDGYLVRGWVHGVRGLLCWPFPCLHDDGGKSIIGVRISPPAEGFGKLVRVCSALRDSTLKRLHTLACLARSFP